MAESVKAFRSNTVKPLHSYSKRRQICDVLYTKLHPWETRLLRLEPGDFDNPLVATLYVAVITHTEGFGIADLDQNVEFEALSYTWGNEVFSHPLVCNGLVLGITANLSAALRHLRQAQTARYLWIDAVCIHQSDNDEKAKQIRNLQLIFGRAIRVIAWLGEERESTDVALASMKSWTFRQACRRQMEHDRSCPGSWLLPKMESASKLPKAYPDTRIAKILADLCDLITRPWLCRAWVVQEIHAAKSVVVRCGSCSMLWGDLQDIAFFLTNLKVDWDEVNRPANPEVLLEQNWRSTLDYGKGICEGIAAVEFLGRFRQHENADEASDFWHGKDNRKDDPVQKFMDAQEFYEMLKSSVHLQATDPRDRIWALVGLSNIPITYGASTEETTFLHGINIDYSKPVAQVYAEVTKYLLRWLGRADLFLSGGFSKYDDLPSWLLDLRSMQLPTLPSWTRETSEYNRYGQRTPPHFIHSGNVGSVLSHNADWTILALRGCHVATITSLQIPQTKSSSKAEKKRSLYLEYFFSRLNRNDSDPTAVIEALPSQCLQNWILQTGGFEWRQASSELEKYSKRIQTPFKQKALERLERIYDGDAAVVPQYISDGYVKQPRAWGVTGIPQLDDIIVTFRACDFAVVLRKSAGSTYHCVGRARPLETLLLRCPWPPPEKKDEGLEVLWQETQIPYSSQLAPDKKSYVDEQVFHIR